MLAYYYLISSLPSLSFEQEAPFDKEGFLAVCKNHVSKAQYEALKGVSIEGGKGCSFITKWTAFYAKYKKALTVARTKQKRGLDADMQMDSFISQAISLNEQNPLEAEVFMLKGLFKVATELSTTDPFTEDALFSYCLKLQLIIRKDKFSELSGKTEFNRLFTNMQNTINDGVLI